MCSLSSEETRSQRFLSWPEALSLWVQSLWGANWAARQRQLGKLDYCGVLLITMYLSRILLRLNIVAGWLCTPVCPPPCNKCTRFTDRCMCAHTCAFMHACSQKCRCAHNHRHTHTCIYLHLSLACSTSHTNRHPMWHSQASTALWPVPVMELVCVQSRYTVLWCSQAPKSMAWHENTDLWSKTELCLQAARGVWWFLWNRNSKIKGGITHFRYFTLVKVRLPTIGLCFLAT